MFDGPIRHQQPMLNIEELPLLANAIDRLSDLRWILVWII
jgi:hypothetical protein